MGRTTFVGPGYADADLGPHKDLPIKENLTAQFRFEMFNAFNRVNLQAPNNSINSPTFMQIRSAYQPRAIQLAARFFW